MTDITFDERSIKYLKMLSRSYPTIQSVCTEIINLRAILNLPKGTEHFISDIHGEYQGLRHILRTASGSVPSGLSHNGARKPTAGLATQSTAHGTACTVRTG